MRPLLASENGRHFEEPQLVPLQITSEDSAQKFHTDDASLSRSELCFCLVEGNFPHGTTNQKRYPDVGSDTSSVSHGIFSLALQTSFRWETKGGVAKCRPFSQTSPALTLKILFSSSDFIKLATTVPLPEA